MGMGGGMAVGGPEALPLMAAEAALMAAPKVALLAPADGVVDATDTPTDENASETDPVAGRTRSARQPTAVPAVPRLPMAGDEPFAEEHGDAAATVWAGTKRRAAAHDEPSVEGAFPDLLSVPALEVLSVP